MKVLAILILVLALSGQAQTPRNRGNIGKTAQPETTSNTKPAQQPAPIPKEVPAQQPQGATDNGYQGNRQEASSIIVVTHSARHDWVDYLGLLISFVLVIITGTGVIAALLSLPEIFRQAKAAEDAAKAAMKSADSQINIERPWLLIENLETPRYMKVSPSDPTTLQGTFLYTIRNYGKTPARVCALKMRFELGELADLPPNPTEVFGIPDFLINPHIIPQNDSRRHTETLSPALASHQDREVNAGKIFLWAYGFVRYLDVHGGYYETRICYRYNSTTEELQIDGPREYNNAT